MFNELLISDTNGLRARVETLLSAEETLALVIRFEVTLAEVQAEQELIPVAAATEIARAARENPPPAEQVRRCFAQSGHPMVAMLDAFGNSIALEAAQWLHYGTTTSDVIYTVRMLQLQRIADDFSSELQQLENTLARLARTHRATPMIGRTLGRHAQPLTFGYKVAIWLSDLRRCSERLQAWQQRYPSGVLSGAVGTHALMGEPGPEVETEVMKRLGLAAPRPADSKGSLDVFADFGATLAICARVAERIAQEIFLLQGDDLRELALTTTAVGSSTMPHKSNPSLCIEVMSCAREVAAALPVLLEGIVVIFDRDSHQNGAVLDKLCLDMAQLLSAMSGLLAVLQVNPEQMLKNLERTNGAILTEQITRQLADSIGRLAAHELMRAASRLMAQQGISLTEALAQDERTCQLELPAPAEVIGLAPELVDQTLSNLGYHR